MPTLVSTIGDKLNGM